MVRNRPGLVVRTLGRPRIVWRGRTLELSGTKPAAVVYVLAIARAPVARRELSELLWGEPRGSNLRTALYALRKHGHGEAWLRCTGDGRALALEADVDLDAFERAAADGASEEALALLPGPAAEARLLDGFEVPGAPGLEEWLESERARAATLVRDCLAAHARRRAASGAFAEAAARLREALALDPYDEALHRELMEALHDQGQSDAALEQYARCRRLLAQELGVAPLAETASTYERIRRGAARRTHEAAPPGRGHAIGFVGRERELGRLEEALSGSRLVTLLGPGGIGKSRLALEATRRSAFARQRATHMIPLGALASSGLVVAAIANALRVGFEGSDAPEAQLGRALAGAPTLLVLDEAEHLEGLAEVLRRLLRAAPGVSLLVTSRRALGLSEERIVELHGLATRTDGEADAADLSEAVRLFATAAKAAHTSFELNASTAPVARGIARALGGHPLAIVLAAGWLRFRDGRGLLRSLHEDLLQLENPGLDVDARHTSLRRVMDSSWDRLTEKEQRILASLSWIRGRFGAPISAAVAGADARLLLELAGKSLLQADADGLFALHPMVRAYARERLRESGGEAEAATAHAQAYLQRLAESEARLLGPDPGPTLDRLDREFEDVRAAWRQAARHGCDHRMHEAMRAAVEAFSLYADMRARFADAIEVFADAAAQQAESPQADADLQASLRAGQAMHLYRSSRFEEALAVLDLVDRELDSPALRLLTQHRLAKIRGNALAGLGRYPEAESAYREALHLSRADLPAEVGRDLRSLANLEMVGGRREAAERHYREAIARNREWGYLVGLAIDLNNLAELLVQQGRLREAETLISESLAYAEGVDVHLLPYLKLNQAEIALRRERPEPAEARAREAQELAVRFGQPALQSRAATALGRAALLRDDLTSAAELFQEALAITQEGRATAAWLHALRWYAAWAEAAGDAALAASTLGAVARHPATEAIDREAAELRLGRTPRRAEPRNPPADSPP